MLTYFVCSAVIALYPRSEFPGIEDCDVGPSLETFRREAPATVWLGVVVGALVSHLTPLFTVFIPLPASWLQPGVRDRHASRIASTNLYLVRQAIFVLKLLAGMCWGGHPSVRAKLSMPPLPTDRARGGRRDWPARRVSRASSCLMS